MNIFYLSIYDLGWDTSRNWGPEAEFSCGKDNCCSVCSTAGDQTWVLPSWVICCVQDNHLSSVTLPTKGAPWLYLVWPIHNHISTLAWNIKQHGDPPGKWNLCQDISSSIYGQLLHPDHHVSLVKCNIAQELLTVSDFADKRCFLIAIFCDPSSISTHHHTFALTCWFIWIPLAEGDCPSIWPTVLSIILIGKRNDLLDVY